MTGASPTNASWTSLTPVDPFLEGHPRQVRLTALKVTRFDSTMHATFLDHVLRHRYWQIHNYYAFIYTPSLLYTYSEFSKSICIQRAYAQALGYFRIMLSSCLARSGGIASHVQGFWLGKRTVCLCTHGVVVGPQWYPPAWAPQRLFATPCHSQRNGTPMVSPRLGPTKAFCHTLPFPAQFYHYYHYQIPLRPYCSLLLLPTIYCLLALGSDWLDTTSYDTTPTACS